MCEREQHLASLSEKLLLSLQTHCCPSKDGPSEALAGKGSQRFSKCYQEQRHTRLLAACPHTLGLFSPSCFGDLVRPFRCIPCNVQPQSLNCTSANAHYGLVLMALATASSCSGPEQLSTTCPAANRLMQGQPKSSWHQL